AIVQRQRLDVGNDFSAERLDLLAISIGYRSGTILGMLILHLAHLAIGVGDAVEGLDDLRLQLGFHGRKRKRVLIFVVVIVGRRILRRLRLLGNVVVLLTRRSPLGRRSRLWLFGYRFHLGRSVQVDQIRRRGSLLGIRTGIGGLEIDDIAQQDFTLGELVAPDDDGLEC